MTIVDGLFKSSFVPICGHDQFPRELFRWTPFGYGMTAADVSLLSAILDWHFENDVHELVEKIVRCLDVVQQTASDHLRVMQCPRKRC